MIPSRKADYSITCFSPDSETNAQCTQTVSYTLEHTIIAAIDRLVWV